MKIFILFLSFISLAQAVSPLQISMKPDREFMQYFLDGYIPWFQKSFSTNIFQINLNGGPGLIEKALKDIDHWKTSENTKWDQLLIGQKILNGRPHYSFRIYLPPELRKDHSIRKLNLSFSPHFLLWNTDGEVCFVSPGNKTSFKIEIPSDVKNFLTYFCKRKNGFLPSKLSFTTGELSPVNNPFKNIKEETRLYGQNGLEEVFYYQPDTHIAKIPLKHYHYINTHGEKTFLPFDKYSTDKEGNLTIYYP